MELIEIAKILINKIKKDYNGDVSLVHIHGSYFYKDTHNLSDLDLYFVPKTERGYNLGQTFILDGVGFDLWALSWERLERIANHEEKTASIITDGEILYSHSAEDVDRFNRLKEKSESIGDKNKYVNNGKEIMKDVYKQYFKIVNCDNITDVRKFVIGIIYNISFVLAQINCTPIKRGRKYLKQEIMSMELTPKKFEDIYEKLFKETNIKEIKGLLYELIENTEDLFGEDNKDTFYNVFNGFYEEMIQSYNKIYHACEIGDIITPLFASVELTSEIEELFARSNCIYQLPDMVGSYDPNDLEKIKRTAKKHQEEFVKILEGNEIKIKAFNNLVELKSFLEKI